MKLLSVVVVLVLVGQLEAVKLAKEEYADSVEAFLVGNTEDKSHYEQLKDYLQTLGPDFNSVADEVYTYHKNLINLYKTADDVKYCLSGGPEVAHQVREAMSFSTPEKTPTLSKITKELLTKYALLCRKSHQQVLVDKAQSFSKDLQVYVDQLFSIAENTLKGKVTYEAYGPLSVDFLLSDYELASAAYSVIISHQDEEIQKIIDPKASVSTKLVSSVYVRYVRTPCDRYVRALGKPADQFMGAAEIDNILGKDTSDEAAAYNSIAAKYAICRHFAENLAAGEQDPMEEELARVITSQTGKKVKGPKCGLIACFGGN